MALYPVARHYVANFFATTHFATGLWHFQENNLRLPQLPKSQHYMDFVKTMRKKQPWAASNGKPVSSYQSILFYNRNGQKHAAGLRPALNPLIAGVEARKPKPTQEG